MFLVNFGPQFCEEFVSELEGQLVLPYNDLTFHGKVFELKQVLIYIQLLLKHI